MTDSSAARARVAVVTGSSSGIGRSIAKQLAQDGMHIVLHGRSMSEPLDRTIREIQAIADQGGRGVQVGKVLGDFSTDPDWQEFVDQAWAVFGSVDCWINNAGGDVLTGEFSDRSLDEKLDYLWRTDVVATLMLSRLTGQKMLTQYVSDQQAQADSAKIASIVNIGWDQAAHGMEGDSGQLFATTKGAIMAMTKSLAQTLAPRVRVNCVAPGWIQTSWGQQTSEYWDQRAREESLMGRWGNPEDIANAVSFLCREQSSFICGQVLPVNGGFRFGKSNS